MASIIIYKDRLSNKLNRNLQQKSYINLAERNTEAKFNAAIRDALNVFENHPVTKELQDEYATKSILGRGNIASALGIYEGDGKLLIAQLKRYLSLPTTYNKEYVDFKNLGGAKGVVYTFRISGPTKEELYKVTPVSSGIVEWGSGSWAQLLEEGLPHFGGMVYNRAKFQDKGISRSKQAIQNRNAGNDASASPIPFVSEIVDAFFRRFGL